MHSACHSFMNPTAHACILYIFISYASHLLNVDTTMDWMYEGPASQMDKQAADDYLLGKVYKPKGDDQTDLHKMRKYFVTFFITIFDLSLSLLLFALKI